MTRHWTPVVLLAALLCGQSVWAQDSVCAPGTTGGTGGGANCQFPYIYQGTEYNECIDTNHDQLWCATTADYENDRLWGNCITSCESPSCPVPTTGGSAAGANCVFPFTYAGAQFTNCITTGGLSASPWCATTDNWDVDGLWGECIIYTSQNNAPCVFPFTYNGEQFYSCTTAGGTEDILWCGITSDVQDTDGSTSDWGYCQLDGVCSSTPTAPPTVTPTPPDACDQAISTTGGNANGANCVFPFTYRGDEYSECITANNNDIPWCGTTSDYDSDRQWGNCGECVTTVEVTTTTTAEPTTSTTVEPTTTTPEPTTTTVPATTTEEPTTTTMSSTATPTTSCPGESSISTVGGTGNGADCVFPFLYRGEDINECIDNNNGGVLWCATTYNYDAERLWGNCDAVTCIDSTSTATQTVTTTVSVTPTTSTAPPELCPIEVDGTPFAGQFCVFPFLYQDELQYECITDNHDQPWCSVTENYDDDRDWGNCIISTVAGDRCVFPFTYNGEMFMECTEVDQVSPWCALTSDVGDDLTDTSTWAFCDIPTEPCPTSTTSTTDQATSAVSPGCTDTFELFHGTLSYSGDFQSGVITLQGCMDACLAVASCVAFDWNIELKCFLQEDGYLDRLNENAPNVDQYRRVPCEVTTSSTQATTIVTAGSSEGCTDDFIAFEETNSFGGSRDASASTVEECTESCLADDDCLAFDFSDDKCFLHYDGYLNRLGTVATSTQYRRQACQLSTATGSVTTPECLDQFTEYPETLALGGDRSDDAMTVESCQDECRADSSCIAFDFNTNTNLCYFHDELTDVVTNVPVVNQYRREGCVVSGSPQSTRVSPSGACVDSFTEVPFTLAFDGTGLGTLPLDECLDICRSVETCVAIDYNRLTMKCFWHEDGYQDEIRSADNVDQYRRVPCAETTAPATAAPTTLTVSQECVDSFTQVPNTNSLGGTDQGFVEDADECADICLADDECQAFDFNSARSKCFTLGEGYLDMLSASSPTNIDQYRRVFCGTVTTQPTTLPDVTSTVAASTAATTEVAVTSTEASVCDDYLEYPNTRSPDGQELVGLDNVEDCKDACTDDADCLGFDFNRNNDKCFAHYDESYLANVVENAAVIDQYRKNTDCVSPGASESTQPAFVTSTTTVDPGVTGTVSGCDNFTPFEDTRSDGGVLMPPDTLEQCLSLCMNTVDCEAVDFYTTTNDCYTHVENFLDNVELDVNGVDQYRRNFC